MARQKEFDRDEVLKKAMELFWYKGYEATSISDLVEHMGINRASLYDTFGDKHRLFLAALDRYGDGLALKKLATSPQGITAIRNFFANLLRYYTTKKECKGCLMTNTLVELALHDQDTATKITAHLQQMEDAFYQALIYGQAKGEIEPSLNLRAIARYLTSSANGLSVMAKAKPDTQVLQDIVEVTLAVLSNRSFQNKL
ncbi:MAG: TetR/AcrR family transcriptional regulator [Spirulinaceae cyanobacterium]